MNRRINNDNEQYTHTAMKFVDNEDNIQVFKRYIRITTANRITVRDITKSTAGLQQQTTWNY